MQWYNRCYSKTLNRHNHVCIIIIKIIVLYWNEYTTFTCNEVYLHCDIVVDVNSFSITACSRGSVHGRGHVSPGQQGRCWAVPQTPRAVLWCPEEGQSAWRIYFPLHALFSVFWFNSVTLIIIDLSRCVNGCFLSPHGSELERPLHRSLRSVCTRRDLWPSLVWWVFASSSITD